VNKILRFKPNMDDQEMRHNSQTAQNFNLPVKIGSSATLIILFLLLLFSCTAEQPANPTLSGNNGYSDTYTRGPFTLTQKIDKREITVADQVKIILETTAPENFEVTFPQYKKSLGDFTLVDTQTVPPRLTGAGNTMRIIHTVSYTVEPYLPGTYTIPAMTVVITDKQHSKNPDTVATGEKQIEVKSLLPKDAAGAGIKDIKGPLSLPPNNGTRIVLAALVLLLVALGGAGLFYWRKISRRRIKPEIRLLPHETAFIELEKLLAENLLAKGEIKVFHLRLSDILRRYIEYRFGVKAPEQTTEEFLTAVSDIRLQEKSILGNNSPLLADFLIHCDLVKFARHEPTTDECQKTVSLCREFIEKTKESRGENERSAVSGQRSAVSGQRKNLI